MSQQEPRRQPRRFQGTFEKCRGEFHLSQSVDTARASKILTLEENTFGAALECLLKPERRHDRPRVIRVAKSERSAHEPDKLGGEKRGNTFGSQRLG